MAVNLKFIFKYAFKLASLISVESKNCFKISTLLIKKISKADLILTNNFIMGSVRFL